ncbi:hypothetical protein H0A61_02061 [Koleobacter methoxysyntrophicus]|uniref:DUF4062 domain-containing protein n=1 Tax=Koleobacter methoxysyntrophicus TaxID=2751313 RepID=A0A8A0RP53_9FIRM|nr:DUF4062 domain-containing protein [Koleobacter methoxysyntrophicus]QSQ09682.1 hypothetical protein H0A61_02061 [Koleobacter methoxysyntrophicus]
MAKPRVFLSSTYYDLKYVRNDLERFIKQLGYEPVMSEKGHIPFGRDEALEQYCYREISTCDIVVHIIGSRIGSQSSQMPYSVSQQELKTAYELHKQIYIFIERSVHVEYKTFLKNENNPGFTPQYVNDIQIYKFIKEIYNYPTNNVIADFDSVNDIIEYLREQWAGLFQRFLQDESRKEDFKMSANLKSTAETLAKIIEYTTRERDETIKNILVSSHPIFNQLAEETKIPIRIFFTNIGELDKLLTTFGYEQEEIIDNESDVITYTISEGNYLERINIQKDIFDEAGNLKAVEHGEWERQFVSSLKEEKYVDFNEDDLPF